MSRAPATLLALLVPAGLATEAGCDFGCRSPLEDWCFHEETEDGPRDHADDASCPDRTFRDADGDAPTEAFRCGRWDVDASGGGFTSETHYYDAGTGELVAVRYTTDVNGYCGGFEYWYGRRIRDCAPDCTYGAPGTGLPACE